MDRLGEVGRSKRMEGEGCAGEWRLTRVGEADRRKKEVAAAEAEAREAKEEEAKEEAEAADGGAWKRPEGERERSTGPLGPGQALLLVVAAIFLLLQ